MRKKSRFTAPSWKNNTLSFFFIIMHSITPIYSLEKKIRIQCSLRGALQRVVVATHECIVHTMNLCENAKRAIHYIHTHISKSRCQNRITVTAIKRMNYTVDIFQINHKSNEKRIKLNIKRYIRANVMWFIAVKCTPQRPQRDMETASTAVVTAAATSSPPPPLPSLLPPIAI